jgi:cytochrome c biogenesis protein CcmG/thiol:disulfide interchange protein DsbE
MKRLPVTIAPLCALVLLVILFMGGLINPRASGSIDSPLIGQNVPLNIKTKPPYIINMFASWCAPCAVEHPALMQLQKQGVRIIGVAYKDTPEKINAYLSTGGNPYAELIHDPKGALGITLGITGVPESFAVDGAGIIRARLQGPFTNDDDVQNFVGLLK